MYTTPLLLEDPKVHDGEGGDLLSRSRWEDGFASGMTFFHRPGFGGQGWPPVPVAFFILGKAVQPAQTTAFPGMRFWVRCDRADAAQCFEKTLCAEGNGVHVTCRNLQSWMAGRVISSHTPFTCLPYLLPKSNHSQFNRLQPSPFRSILPSFCVVHSKGTGRDRFPCLLISVQCASRTVGLPS